MSLLLTRIGFTALFGIALAAAAPDIGVSVNGGSNGSDVQAGSPVLASVTAVNRAVPQPETLEARGPDGARAVLILRPAAGSVDDLGPQLRSTTVVWTAAPEITAALAPGRYAAQLGDAAEIAFRIVPRPAASDAAEQQAGRALLASAYASMAGDADKAIDTARELLALQPESAGARLQLADLLVDRKEYAEALRLLDEAEMAYLRENPSRRTEPPVLIRVRQSRILEAITARP